MGCTRSPFSGGFRCCAFCTGPVNPDVIQLDRIMCEYERRDMPRIRRRNRLTVAAVILILLVTTCSWHLFQSLVIPLAIFALLGCIVLPTLRSFKINKCDECGGKIESNPFEPHVPIVFKCQKCRIVWETGWNHPANDNMV